MKEQTLRLHVLAVGLALGITWGVTVVLLGLAANLFDWGTEVISWLSSLYIGYEPTVVGSLVGGIWGFLDAFVGGAVFAWLYNVISKCCTKRCLSE